MAVLVLTTTILHSTTSNAFSESIRSEFYEVLDNNWEIMILIILLVYGLFLFRSMKRLKERNNEISNFFELRRAFIDSYDDLIYLKDNNFKYVFVNKAVENFLGKDETEIIGYRDIDLVDEELAEKQRKTDLDVLDKRAILKTNISWNNRIYKVIKFPVKLVDGNYGVGAYIEDVTETYNIKKREEKNLLRNQILVDVLTRNFKSTQEQLDYALNESLRLTESKFGYIYLYDEDCQEFILNSWSKGVMAECEVVDKQTRYQLELTGLWGEIVRQRRHIIVNDYSMPNSMKKGYPKGHVQISKFMSVPIIIYDEIVAVVGLANKEEDYDDNDIYQITALMNGVWNAKENRETLVKLAIERNKFLQTLISIGDGVMVVNLEGKVTMLNTVAERMTGWRTEEVEGLHYKEVFDLSYEDGKADVDDPIEKVLVTNTTQELETDAILTSRDGTSYYIEDSAAPIKDDEDITIGVVLVFRDVTEKTEQRRKIEYLSFHDALTGLYNRAFFEEELKRLDKERNLPISIIVGDMNGLKLTNDIFGHESGDLLLKKAAEVFKRVCRADDIIARVGGDEFTFLLPKTKLDEAEKIILRIKKEFSKVNVKAIRGSISMGCETKANTDEDISQVLKNAEDKMYSVKTTDRNDVKTNTIRTIIKTLYETSPREEERSKNVSRICENIGRAMNLSEVEVRRVKEAGLLHNIGKAILDKNLLNKKELLTEEEAKEMRQHPVLGFRILNRFDNTLDLAEAILSHHERWDGLGYPKRLKGKEIPRLARIIAVAEHYDSIMNNSNGKIMTKEEIVEELLKRSGTRFDPDVVDILVKIILDNDVRLNL